MRYLLVLGLVCLLSAQTPRPKPEDVKLVGDRFKPLTYQQMDPAQKKMIEHLLAGPRGGTGGPFNVLLRSPEMGDAAQEFGAMTRFKSSLPPKLNEFAIILTARFWSAQFEWNAHKRAALQQGLNPAIVEAVTQGKRPAQMDAKETALYNFCTEVLKTHQASDATFAAAVKEFGERGVVDIMGVMGWYQFVSMLLNVDRYPLPEGVQPELKPLE